MLNFRAKPTLACYLIAGFHSVEIWMKTLTVLSNMEEVS